MEKGWPKAGIYGELLRYVTGRPRTSDYATLIEPTPPFIFNINARKNAMDTKITLVSLIVSILALSMSFLFWRRQFRPIVTASVRTVKGGNTAITYALKIMNSGTIPAKNITLQIDETEVTQSLGASSSKENKEKWLHSINQSHIYILQNGDATSCSFGFTRENNCGFWVYGSELPIVIAYEGWFGYKYEESQLLKIQDSDSFTGFMWD